MARLEVDGGRLWSTVMASAEIGALPEGGLRRLTLTDSDQQMRNLFARWANVASWRLSIDQLGTMILHRPGTDETLAPVVIGSHLDTQWAGGRFDGIMGVMAGLEVLRTLDDKAYGNAPAGRGRKLDERRRRPVPAPNAVLARLCRSPEHRLGL